MKSGVEILAQHPGWKSKAKKSRSAKKDRTWPGLKDKSPAMRAVTRAVKDAFGAELAALHNLQSACQVALRDVPHQKGCIYFGKPKGADLRAPALCGCIRRRVAELEFMLGNQLG